jgi:gamma-glutamylcyclotransferase (GGCT)/AIG2-like uncharacterized protein YtfP
MAKVLGFSVYKYDKQQLENLDDFEKYKWYLEDEHFDTKCYHSIKTFFESLNNDCLDTENFWWFMVEV